MKILFEDVDIVVCEKDKGMIAEEGEGSVIAALTESVGTVFPVHRLDKGTGGVMVFAKNARTAAVLSGMIRDRACVKTYRCVVEGVPDPAEGEMNDLLFRDGAKNKSYVVDRERRGVKKASLSYRVLQTVTDKDKTLSLCEVTIRTGRTHQIRVQFSHRGLPLLGDGKYGSKSNACTTALWSSRLTFAHPVTGKTVDVTDLPPLDYPWTLFSE